MNNKSLINPEKTIVDLLNDIAQKNPNKVAIEFNEEQLTFSLLQKKSDQLSLYLQSLGIQNGDIIGIALNRSPELIICLLAIIKTGATFLPLDPEYPTDRIEFMLEDSEARLLITEKQLEKRYNTDTKEILIENIWDQLENNDGHNPKTIKTKNSDIAYILYTSGSTGKPKGVMIEHGSFLNFLLSMQKSPGLTSEDNILAITTISFDIAGLEIFLPLITGAKMTLIPHGLGKDGNALLNLMENKNITMMQASPGTWYMLLDSGWQNKLPIKALCGGESLPKDLTEKLLGKISELWNMYGPTETTVWSSIKRITDVNDINVGKPIDNNYFYILDKEHNQLSQGEIGEIYIGGKGVARGYSNRPELTKERFIFIENPLATQKERIYQTGDLGYALPNGEYVCLGRIDDQVKIRGYRIELGEIEAILQKAPNIKNSVVVAKDDTIGHKQLVAYVVANNAFSKTETLNFLASKLPDYMIPKVFMRLDKIPLTVNGKTDKKSLPDPDASILTETLYIPPRTNTEKLLADIWRSILNVHRIGINDNFFELGGNSLLAQKTISLILEQNIVLPITKIYQYPTIKQIAEFLNGKTAKKIIVRQNKKHEDEDIAVIAMSGRFPGADTIEKFWSNLKSGKESIHSFSDEELDISIPQSLKENPDYVKSRGLIENPDKFDPAFFGINEISAKAMDPQHRIFLEICWEALESSGYTSKNYDGTIGIYAGSGHNDYYTKNVLSHQDIISNLGEFQIMTLNQSDYLSTRVAYSLNLKGPAITVQTACSTSLLAITHAVRSIRNGECDLALAGGISISVPTNEGHLYEEGSIMSKNGQCRPFDQDAQGTIFSDGGGVVLLKDKKQAERDGDHIYAIIKGIGVNNDGNNKGSFTAPSAEGQATAIQMAILDAKIEPSTISYIEAHGTATPLGDPIEIEGLRIAFGDQQNKQFCAIGSVKSNIGHLNTASGVAGFIKTCLSLNSKQLPASINFKKENPLIDFENSPFYVNKDLRDWNSTTIRRAGVSSFGLGGTNVHIVLEEYPDSNTPKTALVKPFELITWSTKSERSGELYADKINDYINTNLDLNLADLAYSFNKLENNFNYRHCVIIDKNEGLKTKVFGHKKAIQTTIVKKPIELITFVFPGQGAQYLNMGLELYKNEPVFKDSIDECAVILEPLLGLDIRNIIYSNEDYNIENENNNLYVQPTLVIFEYALAKLWISWGITPSILIGHSLGEFVAAYFAGIFSLKDWLYIIVSRAKIMEDAPNGSMLSIRLNAESVTSLLPTDLTIAAINSHVSCVVSGPTQSIQLFSETLKEQNIASKILPTTHAFHSSLMDSSLQPFLEIIKTITLNRPTIPIVSTVTGKWLTDAEAISPEYWSNQLRSCVRFSDAIDSLLKEEGNILTLECGPKSTSTIFIRQQAGVKPIKSVISLDLSSNKSEYESILNALSNVWLEGVPVNWDAFYLNQNRIKVDIPNYAFDRKRYWLDSNVNVNKTQLSTNVQIKDSEIVKNQITDINNSIKPLAMNNSRIITLIEEIKVILNQASGLDLTHISSHKSFIEIGIDSLALTQIGQTLKNKYKIPISFKKIVEEYYTLNLLAEYLDNNLPNIHQSTSMSNDDQLNLIAKQIELLSQQISLLQQGNNRSNSKDQPFKNGISEIISEPANHHKKELSYSQDNPPVSGALLGKDKEGNPAWFIPDDTVPGKFLQIQL